MNPTIAADIQMAVRLMEGTAVRCRETLFPGEIEAITALAARLRAALPATERVEAWRPMESAPKDGTSIVILWRADEIDKLKSEIVAWQDEWRYTDEIDEEHVQPAGFYGLNGGRFVFGCCWQRLPDTDPRPQMTEAELHQWFVRDWNDNARTPREWPAMTVSEKCEHYVQKFARHFGLLKP